MDGEALPGSGLSTTLTSNTCVQSKGSDNEGLVVGSMKSLLTAKASTTEDPREGKLHVGICAGDAE